MGRPLLTEVEAAAEEGEAESGEHDDMFARGKKYNDGVKEGSGKDDGHVFCDGG